MELLGALGFPLALAFLTQIPWTSAEDCSITYITSKEASSLSLKWNRHPRATSCFLDLRVAGIVDVPPVVVTLNSSVTEKDVFGLRPATKYNVILKCFEFYTVICQNSTVATTVPGTTQITFIRAISSTAIKLEWASVYGAEHYYVVVESTAKNSPYRFNGSYTVLRAMVGGLKSATSYNCSVYTANIGGMGASSKVWTITTLIRPPVPVTVTQIEETTALVSWEPVEKVILYRITISDQKNIALAKDITATFISIPIAPCTTYYFSVSSYNPFLETGEPTNTSFTSGFLRKTINTSVDYACDKSIATVTWGKVSEAESFRVVAVDSHNTSLSCTTQSTSCEITGVRCGQWYTVHVTAVSSKCNSMTYSPVFFETAPCAPTSVNVFRECSSNLIILSWAPTNNTDYYKATSVDSFGKPMTCVTGETACFFTNTVCGRGYQFTVYATRGICNSKESVTAFVKTAPCEPDNVWITSECYSDTLVNIWDMAAGAKLYRVEAMGNTPTRNMYSCTSTGNNCSFSGVQCGESLSVWITTSDEDCSSGKALGKVGTTVPCIPQNVSAVLDCASNSITMHWEYSHGANFYIGSVVGRNGTKLTCNTTDTHCVIQGLSCGQNYSAHVIAENKKCKSNESMRVITGTAPCAPANVTVQINSISNHALVSWNAVPNAVSYTAKAVGQDGNVISCNSSLHSCNIMGLRCSSLYNFTVSAQDATCQSPESAPLQQYTGPCYSGNITADVDCKANAFNVQWTMSSSKYWYTALAASHDGHKASCSTNNTSCIIQDLQCGQIYSVTVVISNTSGSISSPYQIQSVPCIPTLSDVKVNCHSNFALVQWKKSMGAKQYKAVAENAQGNTTYCSTSNSSCIVSGLQCGQLYSVTVIASDQQCNSGPSNAIQPGIVPCPPTNVSANIICGKNTVRVSWSPSYGALNYTVMLNDKLSCTTESLSCDIGNLPCGGVYVATLVAHGSMCDSLQSTGTRFNTEPCAPKNLNASLNCYNNEVTATWTNTWKANFYLVEAISSNGHTASCSSVWSSCQLTSLYCGQNYTITVKVHEATCYSAKSTSVNIRTAPCTPRNATTYLYCNMRAMTISWKESDGADSYIATVEDDRGFFTNCQAMGTNSCNVTGLDCGMIYKVNVVASNGYCDSGKSFGKEVHSVPCVATNIKANLDCEIKTATATWTPSTGAHSYIVSAQTHLGHMVTCSTNETTCEMSGLLCGEFYSVSVLAVGQTCNSSAIMTKQLMTQPCVPLIAKVDYRQSTGQIFWHASNGASSYSVEAVTSQGLQSTCKTKDTNCTLHYMSCGQVYNITVTAINDACSDIVTSDPSSLATEPCPPTVVQVHLDCKTNEAEVSWEESSGAIDYVAMFAEQNGHTLSCNTMGTSCRVGPLRCGTVYYVGIQALGLMYNSSDSTLAPLVSGPCPADNLDAHVDCKEDTALVSWSFSDGAEFYRVSARSTNGDTASCESLPPNLKNFCILSNLTCGTNYTLHLVSANKQCEVLSPDEVSIETKPCPPTRVDVDLQCGNNSAVLHWYKSDGVEHYVASAKPSVGMNSITCNTTTPSCVFANLDCKMSFAFTVTAYSKQCESEPSKPVEITTEPCQPQSVTVKHACNNDTITVQWQNVRRADYYMVTVNGDLGYVVESETPHMILETMILCGQSYTISVRGWDNNTCDGPSSDPVKFRAGPCVPQTVQVYTQCENNMDAVVWGESEGAESYTAMAVGRHGHIHTCNTTETNCTWDNLHCSDSYTINIVAVDSQCHSLPSNNSTIYTAPCPPHGLKATLNCSNKVVSLSWDASEMTTFYTAAMYNGSQKIVELSTNETLAYFSEISCSQQYSFTVTAWRNEQCRSTPSSPTYLTTEPCSPSHVVPVIDCISSSASVTWAPVNKAMYYVATFQSEDGQSQNCSSPRTACSLPTLPCGRKYSVFVTAVNDQCNSIPSMPKILHTVPCVPESVSTMVDCMDNTALVSWNRSEGALSYRAIAKDSTGIMVSCESTELRCKLLSLPCSTAFAVNVIAMGLPCSSFPSVTAHFQTVPCIPEINSLYLDCFTNSLLLQWDYVHGATSYTALAESHNHGGTSCKSNDTNCEIEGLLCGQMYTVRLLASDEQCNSTPSTGQKIASVPCIPQNVKAQMNCSGNMAYVEWDDSSGAESYVVNAFGIGGYNSSCSSTNPACQVPDLLCGDTYNISVVAVSQDCNISESSAVELESVPCAPENVKAYYDCNAREVVVSWDPSFTATSYYVFAEAAAGYNSSSNTSDTVYRFDDFLCSMPYSTYVIATNDICSSLESDTVFIETAACEPENVSARLDCDTNTGVVTWTEVDGVDLYNVMAMGSNRHFITCSNVSSACWLPGLECDQVYNLTVTTIDYVCNNSNAYLTLETVPCEPSNLNASTCVSNSTWVTWIGSSMAQSYEAMGKGTDGHEVYSITNTTSTFMNGLKCGQNYCIAVSSIGHNCTSNPFTCLPVQTVPCPPQNVTTQVNCGSGVIAVRWNLDGYADNFHVLAVASDGTQLSCSTNNTWCPIGPTSCGLTYTIRVTAYNGGCYSSPSLPVQESSAPCMPKDVSGNLSCMTNSVWVKWKPARGAKIYTVFEEGNNSQNSSWSTSNSSVEITDVSCGMVYTFFVTASNDQCSSKPSSSFTVKTAPCLLTSISAITGCNSSIIHVFWEKTPASPLYTATAEAGDRSTITCSSTTGTCDLMNAECGSQYVITVASSDKCSSKKSTPYKISTAPCTPVDINIDRTCKPDGIRVSWANSSVAQYFLLTVTWSDGKTQTHNTSVNSYTISKLPCGRTYSLSITAFAGNCSTPASSAVTFSTEPCVPTNLQVEMQCYANSSMLSWDASNGSKEYFAYAQSGNGDTLYCHSINTTCTFRRLQCGSTYNFSVRASNGICNSSFSMPAEKGAAPCAPDAIRTRLLPMEKQVQTVLVSWEPVHCPNVTYLVDMTGSIEGDPQKLIHVFSYWTQVTFFEIPLPCGTKYSVTVQSRNPAGVSKPSAAKSSTTAPCPPPDITIVGDSGWGEMYWSHSVFAAEYSVFELSAAGRTRVCKTDRLSCTLSDVNLTALEVTASNGVGQSNPSRDIFILSRNFARVHPFAMDMPTYLHTMKEVSPPEVNVTVDGTSLHVRWTPVQDAKRYVLSVAEQSDGEPVKELQTFVSRTASTVTDLAPATRYCVSVSAAGDTAASPFSPPVCVVTGEV